MDNETRTFADDAQNPGRAHTLTRWGPFEIKYRVGQGGFGEVFKAFDTTLQREVALKLLMPRGLGGVEESRAVLREARLLARVRHPNVVPVYGVDTHDGRVGFWSDFVQGKTLSVLLERDGPFGPQETASIGIDLARAVGAVHAAGLLHRDIKAGNVMREVGGRILLMDFGLTQDRDESSNFGGTPPYMAPELLEGEPANATTDIYALGILLYHLLTEKYPSNGTTLEDVKRSFSEGGRRRLLDERPDLPAPLARVVETACQPDPSKRHQSAGELIEALSDAMADGSVPISQRSTGLKPDAQPSRRRLGMIALFTAIALPLIGFLAYTLRPGNTLRLTTGGAHETYLKAKDYLDLDWAPEMTQPVKTRFSLNGELSYGKVSTEVHA